MRHQLEELRQQVWAYYAAHGRHDLPWRLPADDGRFDPYAIMVSELMLQQTQVARVIPKFTEFMAAFSTVHDVANAPLEAVLRVWSGLGYNRRAKFLWQAAKTIVRSHEGCLPDDQAALVALPGIGVNTAGAIRAYAFDQPVTFLETNIRTVFIHHYFSDYPKVVDVQLLPLVAEAVAEAESPREWYWALMDYGTYLKRVAGNASRASSTYARQSTFEGSRRQIRGKALLLLTVGSCSAGQLAHEIPDERLPGVLASLMAEQLIHEVDGVYHLGAA